MKAGSVPIVKDLVLVGCGHSHVAVLRNFGMRPLPGVRITAISREVHTPYSGMLPGLIANHYTFDEAHIDAGPLARFAGARLYHDEAIGLDLAGSRVICRHRPPVAFDILSINIGSTPDIGAVPGASQSAVPVKPIDGFVARWNQVAARVVARRGRARIGVVGAGAGGVELILAVQHRLRNVLGENGLPTDELECVLVTSSSTILPGFNGRARRKFERILAERRIAVHADHRVIAAEGGRLRFETGSDLAFDEILWVTAAGSAPWIGQSGVAVDEAGFIRVDDCLRSMSHANVFAAGDIAAMVNHPRPKSGVFAVRQGRPLAANLRRALLGLSPRPFAPQRKVLCLISTGDKYAVAAKGGWYAAGPAIWRWKDWIDRRFMRKYNRLPDMPPAAATGVAPGLADAGALKEISAIAMRCGGCGAKVGSTVLARALGQLQPVGRRDVLVGLHEPDDAAVVEVPPGKAMVHTVDYFRSFIDDPYLFGRIVANHSLSDIFAMGAEPQSALAIATLPHGLEAKLEEDLYLMMSGALEVLRDAHTELVGGHTSEGAELSLGFAVNGLVDADRLLRKGGMRPGDALILTKSLGTGTLFAADMRRKAKARWIRAALASMQQSNRDGAACVMAHRATACTDVTGFGLLGHLTEMIRPSAVDVDLDLAAVPVMEGALETIRMGIFSSLQPQNVRLRRAIRNLDEAAQHPSYPLVFDPQTAGGLLAAVPGNAATECVAELRSLGYSQAAIIGRVKPQGNAVEPIVICA